MKAKIYTRNPRFSDSWYHSQPITNKQKRIMSMKNRLSFTGRSLIALVLIGILLGACAPAATPIPAPTTDPATYVAAAVQTLSVQMTAEAQAHPSATPVPPTATTAPTNTPIPPTATPSLPTATSTATATEAPALAGKALYQATYPENKRDYIPNEHFGLALGFQNTGTVAWDPGTKIVLVSHVGEITAQPDATTNKRIEPGQKVEFNLWAFGSETLGSHTWTFQVYNANGVPIPGAVTSFSYTSH
jgi:hypothetical protein